VVPKTEYRSGPLTMDETDFSYVRGEKRFLNPSNYGLIALPVMREQWANRRLHLDETCNQPAPLSDQQKRALSLIVTKAEPLPDGAVTWRHSYAWNMDNLVYLPGWNSAYSQSVNIAALLFAECKTKDAGYLNLAIKAAHGLITPIANGGLLNDENGLTFFEEYPAPNGLSPYTLNAHILSLNVLYAMADRTEDERFKHFAELGTTTLLKLAPEYTSGKCIKYTLRENGNICHPDYDAYEVVLLNDLHQWTKDDRIRGLVERWTLK
jgi:hypothetical protein